MWRPNPRYSRAVTLLCLTPDGDSCDSYGNPKMDVAEVKVDAEVYPCVNPVTRQALGITTERAFTVVIKGPEPNVESVIDMDNRIYRLKSVAGYDPVQLIVVDTGQTRVEYLAVQGGAK